MKLERFIDRGNWGNYTRDITTLGNRSKNLVATSSIIKHRSPFRALNYAFDFYSKKRIGRIAMISGVANDGQLNSIGKAVSFNVRDKQAKNRKQMWD